MCFTNPELGWEDLPDVFPNFEDPARWLVLLQRHSLLVRAAAQQVRMTAVDDFAMVRRNYAESLEHWRIALEQASPALVVDVGPGAGFPGIVAAAVSPLVQFHLIEPLQKRARFLASAITELGLCNVTVHAIRAEEGGRGQLRDRAEIVIARAVAELRELLEYTAPFARTGGVLALAKGSALPAELVVAHNALSELRVVSLPPRRMRPEISPHISIALLEKFASTPDRYPRRPGVPGKRPL